MSAGDTSVAGLMPLPTEVRAGGGRPGWVGYIGVEDVDAAAGALSRAGGTIQRPPVDVPDVGHFSVVADPQGAVFMLFSLAFGWRPLTRARRNAGSCRLARALRG
jgi:uncharacterized protein